MPDERLGEVVAAAIVRKLDMPTFTAEDMIKFACALAKFKVPSMLFLWDDGVQLPRGATGKIPKRKVRDQIQAVWRSACRFSWWTLRSEGNQERRCEACTL